VRLGIFTRGDLRRGYSAIIGITFTRGNYRRDRRVAIPFTRSNYCADDRRNHGNQLEDIPIFLKILGLTLLGLLYGMFINKTECSIGWGGARQ
jgi:hypothetical protein